MAFIAYVGLILGIPSLRTTPIFTIGLMLLLWISAMVFLFHTIDEDDYWSTLLGFHDDFQTDLDDRKPHLKDADAGKFETRREEVDTGKNTSQPKINHLENLSKEVDSGKNTPQTKTNDLETLSKEADAWRTVCQTRINDLEIRLREADVRSNAHRTEVDDLKSRLEVADATNHTQKTRLKDLDRFETGYYKMLASEVGFELDAESQREKISKLRHENTLLQAENQGLWKRVGPDPAYEKIWNAFDLPGEVEVGPYQKSLNKIESLESIVKELREELASAAEGLRERNGQLEAAKGAQQESQREVETARRQLSTVQSQGVQDCARIRSLEELLANALNGTRALESGKAQLIRDKEDAIQYATDVTTLYVEAAESARGAQAVAESKAERLQDKLDDLQYLTDKKLQQRAQDSASDRRAKLNSQENERLARKEVEELKGKLRLLRDEVEAASGRVGPANDSVEARDTTLAAKDAEVASIIDQARQWVAAKEAACQEQLAPLQQQLLESQQRQSESQQQLTASQEQQSAFQNQLAQTSQQLEESRQHIQDVYTQGWQYRREMEAKVAEKENLVLQLQAERDQTSLQTRVDAKAVSLAHRQEMEAKMAEKDKLILQLQAERGQTSRQPQVATEPVSLAVSPQPLPISSNGDDGKPKLDGIYAPPPPPVNPTEIGRLMANFQLPPPETSDALEGSDSDLDQMEAECGGGFVRATAAQAAGRTMAPLLKRNGKESENHAPLLKRKGKELEKHAPLLNRKGKELEKHAPLLKRKGKELEKHAPSKRPFTGGS